MNDTTSLGGPHPLVVKAVTVAICSVFLNRPVRVTIVSLVSTLDRKMALLTDVMFTKYWTFPLASFRARGCHLIVTVDDVTVAMVMLAGALLGTGGERNMRTNNNKSNHWPTRL